MKRAECKKIKVDLQRIGEFETGSLIKPVWEYHKVQILRQVQNNEWNYNAKLKICNNSKPSHQS